jgi:hypothetical protein
LDITLLLTSLERAREEKSAQKTGLNSFFTFSKLLHSDTVLFFWIKEIASFLSQGIVFPSESSIEVGSIRVFSKTSKARTETCFKFSDVERMK